MKLPKALFFPADAGGSGGTEGTDAGAGGAAAEGGAGAAAAGGSAEAGKGTPGKGETPEGEPKIPEKFLVDGKPDYAKLTKSYLDLEKGQFKRRDEVRAEAAAELKAEAEKKRAELVPPTPGDYELKTEFKIGDREFTLDTKDPMVDWMKGVAHKYGIPKGELDEVIQGYVGQMILAQPNWKTEAEQLGANADARHQRVDGWLRGNLSKENYQVFSGLPATAKLIKAIEEVMTVAGSPAIADMGADLPGETYSRDELTKMMRDPKYSGVGGKIDPAYVQKVRAGFQRLNRN